MDTSDGLDLHAIAADLGFSISEATHKACQDVVADLDSPASTPSDSPTHSEPRGVRSDDQYNAFLACYDEPRVEAEGLLSGLTIAVKDNIAAEGLRMTCGSAAFSLVPSFDAVVVERVLDAGAALIGKANMEPFALGATGENSDFGLVHNPIAEDRVAGGSSSGSGAAVAGGLVDAALGSDTGGSVRIPAACCGIVGIKPTNGLVPRYGFVDMAPSLDVIGPLARDVGTASRVLDTIAGFDPKDPSSSRMMDESLVVDATYDQESPSLTVGLPKSTLDPASPAVQTVVTDTAAAIDAESDLTVRNVTLDLGDLETAFFHVGVVEFSWLLRQSGIARGQGTGYNEELRSAFERMIQARPELDHVARRVLPSAAVDTRERGRLYTAARNEILAFQRRLQGLFEDVDAILMPTIRVPPPEHDAFESKSEGLRKMAGNTFPFNMAGTPAVTLPAGEADGLPISVQIVTPAFEDRRALQLAARIEDVNA